MENKDERQKELKQLIKDYNYRLNNESLSIEEQVYMSLEVKEWKKELKMLKDQ